MRTILSGIIAMRGLFPAIPSRINPVHFCLARIHIRNQCTLIRYPDNPIRLRDNPVPQNSKVFGINFRAAVLERWRCFR